MPRTNYQRGADKERRIVNKLKKEGYLTARSAGSHSIIDVWAINPQYKMVKLIQSKLGGVSHNQANKLMEEGTKLNGVYVVEFELWE